MICSEMVNEFFLSSEFEDDIWKSISNFSNRIIKEGFLNKKAENLYFEYCDYYYFKEFTI